jgi:copper transport protein
MRPSARVLVLLAAVAAALVPAGAASAHAELLGTSPSAGAVVRHVHEVVLRFDEPVTAAPDSIEVTDPAGHRVDAGPARAVAATARVVVQARRAPGVAGTYAVAWHVVSDDGHPEAGSFTFSLGHRSSHVPAASRAGGASLEASYAVLRWVGYAGFCTLAGGTVFALLCWPAAGGLRRTRAVAGAGGLLAWLATWASLPMQGAYDDGTWAHLLRGDTLLATLESRTGAALMSRLLLLVVLGGLLALVLRWGPLLRRGFRHRLLGAGLLLVVLTAATWSSTGHDSVGARWPLAVLSDAVHLTGVALWVGGLVMVLVLRPPYAAVATFSRMALPCVVAVAVTGVFQAQRGLDAWAALVGSDYGRLVLAKVAGLLVLAGLGHLARRRLGRSSVARLGALVGVEVGVALAVLGVASVLVQTAPR